MISKLGMVLSVVLTASMFTPAVEAETSEDFASTINANFAAVAQIEGVPQETAAMERVNINTASAEELAKKLKGVGVARARAIVELRDRLGQFSDIEQLLEVRGIGVRTLNANRDHIDL